MTWHGIRRLLAPCVTRLATRRRFGAAHDDVAQLLRELTHWQASARARAAQRLGSLGVVEAGDALVRAAYDRHPRVRQAALAALWHLDPVIFAETAVELAKTVPRAELFVELDAIVESTSGSLSSDRDHHPLES